MPLSDSQVRWLVQQHGLNPDEYTVDEASQMLVPREPVEHTQPVANETPYQPKITTTNSATKTFVKSFANAAPSAIGGGLGMAGGAALGQILFPVPGVGAAIGAGITALAGGLAGSKIASMAQEEIMPEPWKENVQQAQAEHPYAALAGDISTVPLSGFKPSLSTLRLGGQGATKLISGMAPTANEVQAAVNVGLGAGISPIITAGSELAQGKELSDINPNDILIAAATGALFNKPNAIGKQLGFHDLQTNPESFVMDMLADPQVVDKPKLPIGAQTADQEFARHPIKGLETLLDDLRIRTTDPTTPEPTIIPEVAQLEQGRDLGLLNSVKSAVKTAQEVEAREGLKEAGKTGEISDAWADFIGRIAGKHNTRIETDPTITSGKAPVAGQTRTRVALQEALIKLHPELAGADTPVHELTHIFLNDLRNSKRPRDQEFVKRYDDMVRKSDDYKAWKAGRDKEGNSSTIDEYQATNSGVESILSALRNESGGKKFTRDFTSYLKTRWGKHATEADFQRILNYNLINDPAYRRLKGAQGGGITVNSIPGEESPQMDAHIMMTKADAHNDSRSVYRPEAKDELNYRAKVIQDLKRVVGELEEMRGESYPEIDSVLETEIQKYSDALRDYSNPKFTPDIRKTDLLNSEQSSLFDEKDIRAKSAFAKMRELIDKPQEAEALARKEAEIEANSKPTDLFSTESGLEKTETPESYLKFVKDYSNDPSMQNKMLSILKQGPRSNSEPNPHKPWSGEWLAFEHRPPVWEENFGKTTVGSIKGRPFVISNNNKGVYVREGNDWYEKTIFARNDDGSRATWKDIILKGTPHKIEGERALPEFGIIEYLNKLVKDVPLTETKLLSSTESIKSVDDRIEEAQQIAKKHGMVLDIVRRDNGQIDAYPLDRVNEDDVPPADIPQELHEAMAKLNAKEEVAAPVAPVAKPEDAPASAEDLADLEKMFPPKPEVKEESGAGVNPRHIRIKEALEAVTKQMGEDMMDADTAREWRDVLRDQVDWSEAPHIEKMIGEFNYKDAEAWKIIKQLYDNKFDFETLEKQRQSANINKPAATKSAEIGGRRDLPPAALEATKSAAEEKQQPKHRTQKQKYVAGEVLQPKTPEELAGVPEQPIVPPAHKELNIPKPKPQTEAERAAARKSIEAEWKEVDNTTTPKPMMDTLVSRYNNATEKLHLARMSDDIDGAVKARNRLTTLRMQMQVLRDRFPKLAEPELPPLSSTASIKEQIKTKEFKKWFGDWENNKEAASKVVDEEGMPLQVYHGTAGEDFAQFRTERPYNPARARYLGGDENKHYGIYFTPKPNYAESYTGSLQQHAPGDVRWTYDDGARYYPVFLNIKKPYKTFRGYGFLNQEQINSLIADGYDGVFAYKDQFGPRGEALTVPQKKAQVKLKDLVEIVAFNPEQVKSSIGNKGEFNPNDPNILHSTASIKEPGYERSSFAPFLTSRIDRIDEVLHNESSPLTRRSARYVTRELHKFAADHDLRTGRIGNPMIQMVRGIDPTDIGRVYKYLYQVDNTGKSSVTLSPKNKALADKIVEHLRAVRKEQIDMGLMVKGKDGDFRVAGIKEDGYMFNILSREVAYEWAQHPDSVQSRKYDKAYIDHLISKKVKKADAEQMLFEYKNALGQSVARDVTFNALRKAEGKGLPWELVDQNFASAATRYAKRAARDIAYFKYIENNPKMRKALNLRDQFENLPTPESEPDYINISPHATVQNALRSVWGIDYPTNPYMMAGARVVANSIMGVGTAARNIANMPAFIAGYVQLKQMPLIAKAMSNLSQARVRAFKNNAVRAEFQDFDAAGYYPGNPNPLIRLADKFSVLARKYQGRDFSNRFEGEFYYSLGELLASDNFVRAKQGDKEAIQFLKKHADIVEGGYEGLIKRKISQDDIEKIAKRFVDSARGTYGAEGLPSWAIEGQLAPFAALSRFSIEKANTIYKDVVTPMKKGIYGPLIRYTLATLGSGVLIEKLNQMFSNKRGPDATLEEVEASGDAEDKVAKAIGLLQLASYAGIVGDSAKLAMQAYQGHSQRYQSTLSFPLYGVVTDVLLGNIADASNAIKEGQDPIDVMGQVVTDIATQGVQTFRYLDANVLRPSEAKRKELFRDFRVYKDLTGDSAAGGSATDSNPYADSDIKKFKKTEDLEEAAAMVPSLLSKAEQKAKGNPDRMGRAFNKIKQNNFQIMPDPDNAGYEFNQYYEHLVKVYGQKKADAVAEKFITQHQLNQIKSSMIPTISD